MGAIGRLLAADIRTPMTLTDPYWERHATSLAGTAVTPSSAMSIAAFYACVTVIAETVASVPLSMYRRVQANGEEGKQLASNMPLHDLLHDRPNEYQTALEFREMMTAFALIRDYAIAEIVPGPRGPVDQIKPLHPDLVVRETAADGTTRYRYSDPIKRRTRTLLSDEVFILRGRFGRSVLAFARESIGLSLALEKYAGYLFSRGARPGGVVTHPKTLSPVARENIRKEIDEYAIGGEKSGRPLLLEEGMSWSDAQMSNRDAEFLATRGWGVKEMARFCRVPLHKIQDLSEATFSNIDRQAIEYVTDTILPWAERWEQSISRDLIIAPQVFFAEHNLDGLLRGDPAARAEYFKTAILTGWMSPAEVRQKENLNPVAGLDYYLMPLNEAIVAGGSKPVQPQPVRSPVPAAAIGTGLDGAYLRAIVRENAGRVIRKETASLGRLKGADWKASVTDFYRDHADFVARALHIDEDLAQRYCQARRDELVTAGPEALDTFDDADRVEALTNQALAQAGVSTPPAFAAA